MSAQSVTRIEGSGTTVYQCCTYSHSVQDCASFVSSSRNSNRTTTRSSPHARRPGIVDTSKDKSANLGKKGRLRKEKKKEEGTFHYRNISGEEFIFITVLN